MRMKEKQVKDHTRLGLYKANLLLLSKTNFAVFNIQKIGDLSLVFFILQEFKLPLAGFDFNLFRLVLEVLVIW